MASDEDWRLEAELEGTDTGGALHGLFGRLRGPDVVKDVEAAVAHGVVVTHNGSMLFAYAADEATLAAARSAIEGVLLQDGVSANVRVSHWDDDFDRWRQTDPPPTAAEQQAEEELERADEEIETRTLVVSSGKGIRNEFEQSIVDWANKLELQYSILEHPHMLTTQVAFTVTGPKRKIDEFARGLQQEELQTIRTERAVMLSPL